MLMSKNHISRDGKPTSTDELEHPVIILLDDAHCITLCVIDLTHVCTRVCGKPLWNRTQASLIIGLRGSPVQDPGDRQSPIIQTYYEGAYCTKSVLKIHEFLGHSRSRASHMTIPRILQCRWEECVIVCAYFEGAYYAKSWLKIGAAGEPCRL